ncbi:hypothetical protein K432DRAFT_409167 [Lepidopterella palustris CBS 459.81]|uniref:Heterokaryon incompatibility domain-containing protein n=1 Tax=Lepidopterella palustris CBS 459.81 TaxID=1314670 RepID=A0A8E2E0S0_9PEZI|nr:hypothetical protein K432DRAFT_409167 [Lepidopterella palustris CBS 459.81]
MDHLPLEGEAPIILPFLLADDFKYDGGDFDSYPERCGWDFAIWRNNDRTHRDVNIEEWLRTSSKVRDELPAFLQAWLFFGLLSFALDTEVPVEDFTRLLEDGHSKVLTTAKLETYMIEFSARFPDPADGDQERAWGDRRKQKTRFWTSMSSVANVLTSLAGTLNSRIHQLGDKLAQVQLAASLISHTLCSYMREVLKTPDDKSITQRLSLAPLEFGRSRLIISKMTANKWCPHTMNRLTETCSYNMQAYIYALGTARTSQDHSKCTSGYCCANQAGADFEVQHIGCPSSDCDMIQTPLREVVEVLERGFIPLLEVRFKGRNYTNPYLVVKKADGNTPYAAISHVWADGLGNPRANAIPSCQLASMLRSLQRIQYIKTSQIDKKEAKEAGPMMPFWLDTLCIPVEDQYQSLRDFSIEKMHEIYQQAHCTLVLDPDFIRLNRRSGCHEVLSRVCLSGWITRLWTFQEGSLPPIVYIRVKDGVIDLYSIYMWYLRRHNRDWLRSRPVVDLLVDNSIALFAGMLPRKQDKRAPTDDYSKSEAKFIGDSLWSMAFRMTSRPGDETVCFATTLGFNPASILDIELPKMTSDISSQEHQAAELAAQEKRMVAFLNLLPSVPLSILFSSGERLSTPGYRWAPRTLLHPETTLLGGAMRQSGARNQKNESPNAYVHPKGKGLVAFLPTVHLPRIDFKYTRWQIVCDDGSSFRAGNLFDESSFVGEKNEKKNINILLPAILEANEDTVGLIVSTSSFAYKTWDPKSPRFSFRTIPAAQVLGRVFVKRYGSSPPPDPGTDYVVHGATVKWKSWLVNCFDPSDVPRTF